MARRKKFCGEIDQRKIYCSMLSSHPAPFLGVQWKWKFTKIFMHEGVKRQWHGSCSQSSSWSLGCLLPRFMIGLVNVTRKRKGRARLQKKLYTSDTFGNACLCGVICYLFLVSYASAATCGQSAIHGLCNLFINLLIHGSCACWSLTH